MKPSTLLLCELMIIGAGGCSGGIKGDQTEQSLSAGTFVDDFGRLRVYSTQGAIDRNNPFFQSLGANGRTCNSCHKLENALGISVASIRSIFNKTNGLDPLFSINDGSNAPTGFYSNTSTLQARQTSFSMLLNHGTIRVGIGVPAQADFTLLLAQDPYYFASAAELSLFRRPLPSVNVAFDAHVMWDGRESEGRPVVRDALKNQANDATQGHAQRPTPLDDDTRASIADFQLSLFAAQSESNLAGALDVAGCVTNDKGDSCEQPRGGPVNLVSVLTNGSPGGDQGPFPAFFAGINDSFAGGFKNISFTLFEPWETDNLPASDTSDIKKNRADIGDGENIFYTKTFDISGVVGLNDVLGQTVVHGFCTTCHDTPDVGNHSQPRFLNIGTSSPYLGDNPLAGNIIDFPKYVLQELSSGLYVTTTDPGLALRTGKYADIGRFKVPILRGLGARAPYFHNGQAKTLTDVVNFYNQRFNIGFTDDEIRKVVLFLEQT
jgi:cytochrome c peroxidase